MSKDKLDKQLERLFKKLNKLGEKYLAKCMIAIRKTYNAIKKRHVGKFGTWYRSYIPGFYSRRYELYKIPKIEVDTKTGDFETTYDSERLTKWYRIYKKLGPTLGRDYIAQLSFVDGFHGGARSGPPAENGPFPGDHDHPYYRTPPPPADWPIRYSKWGNPAHRTTSPKDLIERDFEEELITIVGAYVKEYNKNASQTVIDFINKNKQ